MSELEKPFLPCVVCGDQTQGIIGYFGCQPHEEMPCCNTCHDSGRFAKWVQQSLQIIRSCPWVMESSAYSGNVAKDRAIIEKMTVQMEREKDGICPNGCAQMVRYEAGDDHRRTCPVCGFIGYSNVPFEFPYEKEGKEA